MIHLLHPAFVHFTVGFLVVGGLCEVWGILSGRQGVERLGGTLVLLGTGSLLPTVVTGLLAENTVHLPSGAKPLLELHERIGLTVLALFLVSQFWKAWNRGRMPSGQRRLYAALLIVGVALVAYGAFLGGELVFGRGVGVLG